MQGIKCSLPHSHIQVLTLKSIYEVSNWKKMIQFSSQILQVHFFYVEQDKKSTYLVSWHFLFMSEDRGNFTSQKTKKEEANYILKA